MKSIVYLLSLVLFISCYQEKPFAETITISGTVSDENKNLLDSVEIIVYADYLMSMGAVPVNTTYSKKGKFKFEFTPKGKGNFYSLLFKKEGFKENKNGNGISRTKAFQRFDIIMERAIE